MLIMMHHFQKIKKVLLLSAHFQALHFHVLGNLVYSNESHAFSCVISSSLNWHGSNNSLKLFVIIGQAPQCL